MSPLYPGADQGRLKTIAEIWNIKAFPFMFCICSIVFMIIFFPRQFGTDIQHQVQQFSVVKGESSDCWHSCPCLHCAVSTSETRGTVEEFVMSFHTRALTNSFCSMFMFLNCFFSQHFKVPFFFFQQEQPTVYLHRHLLKTKPSHTETNCYIARSRGLALGGFEVPFTPNHSVVL